jgi:predicted acetyltransferase
MSDFAVRVLDESDFRPAQNMFRRALHNPPVTENEWNALSPALAPGRFLGAISGGEIVGTAYSFSFEMLVPGGNLLQTAGLSRVGVRADHTRRGVLTELMRFQLAEAKARGDVIGALNASEAVIYSRFGYGVGTYGRESRLRGARLRPDVPRSGEVRLVSGEEAIALLPELYRRIGLSRPGMLGRGPDMWGLVNRFLAPTQSIFVAVHSGPDGDDGYVLYKEEPFTNTVNPDHDNKIVVNELQFANPGAYNDLWRFLLSLDLVGEVYVEFRPLDEWVELLLHDPRACQTAVSQDELWIRLIDVPEALATRSYGAAEPVVIKVNDPFLPDNTGAYRISPAGAARVDGEPALVLEASTLAMIYLGSVRPSALAAAGRIQVVDPEAVARADKLFASDQTAWCGTFF